MDAWFVMLTVKTTRPYRALLVRLVAATGGTPVAEPHLTIAYLTGEADAAAVANCLRPLQGPAVRVHAHGVFSFEDELHPLFGYQLSLHVRKTARIAAWHGGVVAAIAQLGLTMLHPWGDLHPHVRVISEMAMPPSQALERLGPLEPAFALRPADLVVTHYRDGAFTELLRRPVGGQAQQGEAPL